MYKRFVFVAVLITALSLCFTSVSAASVTLKKGMSRPEVTKLQGNLKKLGFFGITPTGYYGNITVSSVKRLQARYGLETDGVVGSATSSLISKLLAKTTPVAAKPPAVKPVPSRGDVKREFIVVVDAGHGGADPGAVYGGVNEKDLNLSIAKKLNKLLEASGIMTYMTRTDDSFIDLYDISGLANKVNADLLISVHNNADSSSTKGSMSLYCPNKNNSKGNLTAYNFAAIVQKELYGELDTHNLGVIARPNLAILRTAEMPAVIAEVGYMTNKAELGRLETEAFRQKAAEALKNAVLEALGNI